jgi:hypothetical protein
VETSYGREMLMTDTQVVRGSGGRQKIHEVSVEDAVVEIWMKKNYNVSRVYFDITLAQRYYFENSPRFSEYIQLRYLNSAMEAMLKAQNWIHKNKEKYYKTMDEDSTV